MNAAEREQLQALLEEDDADYSTSPGSGCIWLGVLPGALFLALSQVNIGHDRSMSGPSILIGVLMIVSPFLLWWTIYRGKQRQKRWRHEVRRPQLREALAQGDVVVETVEPTEVIEVILDAPEDEFEGSAYLCAIADDQTLLLSMDDLGIENSLYRGPEKDPWLYGQYALPWPNTRFQIVRTVKHNISLGIFCYGEKLEQSASYHNEPWSSDILYLGFDEAIFTGTPQSIVSELQDAYDALKTANGIRNGPP
ncbi:MAG: hypothetical protein ABIY70_11275 [Capsulimonas sp.]|uniref:hypothetical protein n=1 Tax=Capsulimonas sp. TaxID=2494211 RepID=UPI0032667D94